MKNKENDMMDFTQGSILKKLLRFMVPILGALILQAAYGAVDLLVVGRFGSTSGLSGVSTGSQVLNLVTFVVTQLAMGITVLIARYLGEKREEQIGSIIGGDFTGTVRGHGWFCPSHRGSHAGTGRGGRTDRSLHTDLWCGNLFYCGI